MLHKKINRLKTMVEDLFDVAKANSGNLEEMCIRDRPTDAGSQYREMKAARSLNIPL